MLEIIDYVSTELKFEIAIEEWMGKIYGKTAEKNSIPEKELTNTKKIQDTPPLEQTKSEKNQTRTEEKIQDTPPLRQIRKERPHTPKLLKNENAKKNTKEKTKVNTKLNFIKELKIKKINTKAVAKITSPNIPRTAAKTSHPNTPRTIITPSANKSTSESKAPNQKTPRYNL